MKLNSWRLASISTFFLLSVVVGVPTHAQSDGRGACSSHGGVSCGRMNLYTMNVVCNDGWEGSSVSYTDVCSDSIEDTVTFLAMVACRDEISSAKTPIEGDAAGVCVVDKKLEFFKEFFSTCNEAVSVNGSSGKCVTYKEFCSPDAPNLWQKRATVCKQMNASVDYNAACRQTYGANSYGDANFCYCSSGYDFNASKTACILKPSEIIPAPVTSNPFSSVAPISSQNDSWLESQIVNQTSINSSLVTRLTGRILLQTESHGEAWYVDPVSKKRLYMKDGETAYQMLRSFGLGIGEVDYAKIEAGNNVLKERLKGRILLRVQSKGEAYYINPTNLTVHYLRDGAAAYSVMRELSLGIADRDLNRIPIQRFQPKN